MTRHFVRILAPALLGSALSLGTGLASAKEDLRVQDQAYSGTETQIAEFNFGDIDGESQSLRDDDWIEILSWSVGRS
jgi:hypothetical protein